jgi:hypothetical protein
MWGGYSQGFINFLEWPWTDLLSALEGQLVAEFDLAVATLDHGLHLINKDEFQNTNFYFDSLADTLTVKKRWILTSHAA